MGTVDVSLIKPELVFFDIDAEDADDLFVQLGARLDEKGYIKDTWYDAVREREAAYPTGLACESIQVAIPHVDPEHIGRPYIAVVRPAKPVPFTHMAGLDVPVNAELVINLGLLAHAEDQVAVLQALMNIFMDDAKVEELRRQTTEEGMAETLARLCVEAAE